MAIHDAEHVASIMLSWHSLDLITCTTLQTLWAGYGQICAITARAKTKLAAEHLNKLCGVSSGNSQTVYPLILKLISPPKNRKNADEGHLRKILSYEVEQYFYRYVVPHLDEDIGIARFLDSTRGMEGRKDEEQLKDLMATIMVDLRPKFPVAGEKRSVLSQTQVFEALEWLAKFHRCSRDLLPKSLDDYVLPPLEESARRKNTGQAVGKGLWLNGGYTYLATRGKEYASLVEDDSEWSEAMCRVQDHSSLSVAEMAAIVLTPRGRRFESYIHGDVKSQNLFTNESGEQVAFFDFQYVGLGLGVCDLAALFISSVPLDLLVSDEDDLPYRLAMCEGEKELLDRYRNTLLLGKDEDFYDWETFKRHWETALVDWCRFLASWGFWGNTEWLEARIRFILADESWMQWLHQQLADSH